MAMLPASFLVIVGKSELILVAASTYDFVVSVSLASPAIVRADDAFPPTSIAPAAVTLSSDSVCVDGLNFIG